MKAINKHNKRTCEVDSCEVHLDGNWIPAYINEYGQVFLVEEFNELYEFESYGQSRKS